MTEDLMDEIRINNRYSHLYLSEYEQSASGESTPKVNKKVLLTPDYLRRMAIGFGAPTPAVLPPNCRYIEKFNQGHIVVIEEPPAFRTVRISIDFRKEIKRLVANGKLEEYGYSKDFGVGYPTENFTLALPYVIFILHINNLNEMVAGQAFLRVARLTGLSDYILKIPFTNISDSQYICFGPKAGGQAETLNAAVEKVINVFWSAQFNTDYTYNYAAYKDVAGVHSYIEWAALSKENPMFIYSVDWIRIPMNVGQAVQEMAKHYKLSNKSEVHYKSLSEIFSRPLDTGKDEKPTPRSRKKFRLFYDVAEGIYLDDNFYIHVGDPFTIKNDKQICHINSFISFADSGDVKYIRVERDDGRLLVLKYTKSLAQYILESSKKLRFDKEGTLKNGVVIKEDDILIMKNSMGDNLYKKVSYIRKGREGFHEARFGDGFYILENTEAELFDATKPTYEGIDLRKGDKFIYISSINGVPWHGGSLVQFDRVDTDGVSMLNVIFNHIGRVGDRPVKLRLDRRPGREKTLYPIDEIKSLPSFFRHGRSLKVCRDGSGLAKNAAFGCHLGVIHDTNYTSDRANIGEIKKYLLTDDKFSVKAFDLDIEFAIGDKVVVADWKNPVNMLGIKMIQGFKFDESNGDVTFILADREGKLHQQKYVDGQHGTIFVGRIRKITNVFGKLTAGTKIKAREAAIPHFPKKDVNIIIGFITDTGGPDPLVLCSNCCTLWYSDVVEKFQKITIKAKKWAQLQHVPIDIAKIKYQPGDIIFGASDYRNVMGWLVFKAPSSRSLKILDLSYFGSYPDYYSLDRYITANSILDCIPNPRIGPKAQADFGMIKAWPNLHGHYYTNNVSSFRFINDERSIVNVQSSPK